MQDDLETARQNARRTQQVSSLAGNGTSAGVGLGTVTRRELGAPRSRYLANGCKRRGLKLAQVLRREYPQQVWGGSGLAVGREPARDAADNTLLQKLNKKPKVLRIGPDYETSMF